MTSSTRDKMIAGAADLMSRRGVNATSMRDVVRHTATPRGSISHHFPDGKRQLVAEAVIFAGKEVSIPLERTMSDRGVIDGLRAFVASWRRRLATTGFEAGCPVLAVAVDRYVGEASDKDDDAAQQHLLALADGVFTEWRQIMRAALLREGLAPERAERLATLVVAAIEGTVAMCRANRSADALDQVQEELETVLAAALTQAKR
ncbi:TetR/AcrR family transcriptional regulator [Bradyrhizobium sp. WBOS7]|uniref:TetR/AcrR family transcriptional regulator n=2 Tax=Nitrobacteraceae TaxID=41294 RepID=A0AAE9NF64_9BRAD|nr:TetR/AcrR family transcriptional regulator [Bradyrhizobium sp. WBOS2]MDD1570035.1 TetR/AcrR family transcriptional regulator [Bradyrhizobium sp. WBOS1]MDD1576655.1 TetR/AcrR family transcriptional regulator [Bradyrhizobium sp. WBOS7]MDD1598967.1 TetR/AcrR family transcriptional regulator [Bradyrhizobium sp. WBOS16]UUO36809.1 TetR/AcrR family transcriptional regulator [Bradyrhizobium sp. WBOS01]UUO43113.1 TetR/AcrR family transcriptional regulator [Bradyrhizobium sp. WBOS02]UUO53935.1 TetR/